MKKFFDLIRLIRPEQWLKNGFVFTGIFFANAWSDLSLLYKVILSAFSFCLISSSLYIINDIVDQENDRNHPKKKFRPIAAGEISPLTGLVSSLLLMMIGFCLGYWVSWGVFAILSFYIFLNLAYSFYLKHVVILDVFCISAGFMLRILAGTLGVGIPPSNWLLLCSLLVTLFMGFSKRRAEILTLRQNKEAHRRVLANYGPILLDEIIAICATGVIITYSLYTMSPQTIAIHQTENLIYTVPFVIYAIFRYIFLLHHRSKGGEPSKDLLRDPHIIFSVLGWLVLTLSFIKNSG